MRSESDSRPLAAQTSATTRSPISLLQPYGLFGVGGSASRIGSEASGP